MFTIYGMSFCDSNLILGSSNKRTALSSLYSIAIQHKHLILIACPAQNRRLIEVIFATSGSKSQFHIFKNILNLLQKSMYQKKQIRT